MIEPQIIINGIALTEAQARVVRMAMDALAANLEVSDLGDRPDASDQWAAFQKQIGEVIQLIDSPVTKPQ